MNTTSIRLSQVAPWNATLGNGYRTRWTLVAGRRFKVYAETLNGVWFVEEVDEDGECLHAGNGHDAADWTGSLGIAFNLTQARELIAATVNT